MSENNFVEAGFKLIFDSLPTINTKVLPPNPDLVETYKTIIDELVTSRGGTLFYNYVGTGKGNGLYVELLDGSVKLDLIGGIGVHGFGHCNHDIIKLNIKSALQNTVMQGHLQQNINQVKLIQSFNQISGMDHCILTSSGAMANENALKLMFNKRPGATRMFAFEKCFAGRTLALANMTDKASYRAGLPQSLNVDYIPFYDSNNPESLKNTLNVLLSHLDRYTPNAYAGMIMELVQGEGGYNPGDEHFFKELISVLRTNDIKVCIDEIQTFGRHTSPFAFQHFNIPLEYIDVISVGKITQVCATLFKKYMVPPPGLISQTYTSSNSAIDTGQYVLDNITEFCKNTLAIRIFFVTMFNKLGIKFNLGSGTMLAIEVGDYDTTVRFVKRLFENGIIAFIAGSNPTRVRFLPPPFLSIEHYENAKDEIFEILTKTLYEVGYAQ